MSQRSRLLIYERKEVVLLGILSLLVAVFAFTFGIHLGKRVPPKSKPTSVDGSPVGQVNPISDQAPTRAEAQEKVAQANAGAGQILDQTLKEEVAETGIQMEKPVQVELPKKTISEKKAASEQKHARKSAVPAKLIDSALARHAPSGAFTIQILAAPVSDQESLGKALSRFAAMGMEPWARRVEIPGKGTWIRLYQGGFTTREAAEKSGSSWKSAGKVDGYVVAKIPAGASSKAAETPAEKQAVTPVSAGASHSDETAPGADHHE